MPRIPHALRCALAILLLPSAILLAQDRRPVMPPGVEDLPIGLAPHERPVLGGGWTDGTPPPAGPARAAAEWDPSQGVFCLWNNGSLCKELASENSLYVITTNTSWWNSFLSGNGVNMSNVQYLVEPTNTFWVRDYGPWFIWDGNQDFGLVDNIYNRPRPLDDVIPSAIASTYGVSYYGMDVVHTGGNYYADGFGNAWSSTLPYSENPGLTEAQVNQYMSDFLGIARYITRDLKYDIQHIDTFGKPLAPDRLLWGSFPVNSTPWAWSEGAYDHYRTLQSPYGWPYKIFRIPLYNYGSSWTAYINCLQTNHKIIIPSYGGTDAAAQAIIENAAPGYEVKKVSNGGTYWGDSVHCRTRNFVQGEQVRIYPQPHWEKTDDDVYGYPVTAEVITDNSTSLNGSPIVYWSLTGGAPFTALPMTPTGQPHEFSAVLPAQPHGTRISYYFHAADLAGQTRDYPYVALQGGLFTIEVTADNDAPEVEHVAIHSARLADWPLEVECLATDDGGIPTVVLEYSVNGIPQPAIPLAKEVGTFRFAGSFAGGASLGDLVEYRIVATDTALSPKSGSAPQFGWNAFTIDNVKPILVVELDKTPDSSQRWAGVCDDLGLTAELTTEWPAVPSNYEALVVCVGMNPTHRSLSSSQANALVSYLSAGGAAYLEGGNAWAQSSTASIYRSWFGVSSAGSGANITGSLVGVNGTPTEGMSFDCEGEVSSSDDLNLASGATASIREGGDNKALTYATGNARTVASSFQFGGLVDATAPSHAKRLAAGWLDHLGMEVDLIVSNGTNDPSRARLTLEGEPGARYLVFFSPAPGYQPRGPQGVLLLESTRMRILSSGKLPPTGILELDVLLPFSSAILGQNVFFQALVENVAGGGSHLTNRDRIDIGL